MSEKPNAPRVLYLVTSNSEGGIERHSVRLAAHLKAHGVPISYACRPDSFVQHTAQAQGVPTIPIVVKNSGDLQAVRKLADILCSEQIDVLHVHSRRDFFPALMAVALAKSRRGRSQRSPKLVLHVHLVRALGEPARLNGWVFARGTDAILTVSQAVRTRVLAQHALPESLVRVLHNGADLTTFAVPHSEQAMAWRDELRQEWKISNSAPTIGMIGRLDAKGQDILLAITPELLKQIPDLQIVLAGPEGQDGDRERFFELSDTLGIAEHVHVLGPRYDIPAVLAAVDLLAHLPSDDAFPSALIEAMASGLPIVVTDTGGCPEIVENQTTGIIVPVGDYNAITKAILRLFASPESAGERRRIGDAGRARAISEFSLDHQIDQLSELYQELCPTQSL